MMKALEYIWPSWGIHLTPRNSVSGVAHVINLGVQTILKALQSTVADSGTELDRPDWDEESEDDNDSNMDDHDETRLGDNSDGIGATMRKVM